MLEREGHGHSEGMHVYNDCYNNFAAWSQVGRYGLITRTRRVLGEG